MGGKQGPPGRTEELKLFVGVCNSQTTLSSAFFWSWEGIKKTYPYQIKRFDDDDTIIRNNQMIRDFLKSDCDVMVKMDIDQVYPKNYFSEMVPLVEKYKLAGPLIYNKWRKNNYSPLLAMENTSPILRVIRNWEPLCDEKGLLKIPYAHTNLFYAREVLENVDPPWYRLIHGEDGCSQVINRDYTFLEKLVSLGYETVINTNVEVGHLVEEEVDSITHMKWVGPVGRG